MKIEFDPVLHRYRLDGRPVPGCHEIGTALGLVRLDGHESASERHRVRGQRIHEAIALAIAGRLDESSCPSLLPYVRAAERAVRDLGLTIRPGQVEVLVANPGLGYATTIDALASASASRGSTAIAINWKSGVREPFHALQAAAERLCLPGADWASLYLYLHPDAPGSDGLPYTAVWFDDPRDEELWRAACALYDWLCRSRQSVRPRATRSDQGRVEVIPFAPRPSPESERLFRSEPDDDQIMESTLFPSVDQEVD